MRLTTESADFTNHLIVRENFDSLDDMLRHAESPCDMERRSRESLSRGNADWSGTETLEEAVELCRTGWPEGVSQAAKYSTALSNVSGMVARPEIVYDVYGTTFDVGCVLAGVPDCWLRSDPGESVPSAGDKVVRIVCNVAASSNVSAETMVARGVAAVALAECLEAAMIPTEIVLAQCIVSSARGNKYRYEINETVIKHPGQPLDLARIAFAFAHPAMLRRVYFAIEEHLPANMRTDLGIGSGSGYGQPWDPPIYESAAERREIIYIPRLYGGCEWTRSPEGCRRWIVEQLRNAGVALTEEAGAAPPSREE